MRSFRTPRPSFRASRLSRLSTPPSKVLHSRLTAFRFPPLHAPSSIAPEVGVGARGLLDWFAGTLTASLSALKEGKEEASLMEEKAAIVDKSLEMIQLGIEEAQVMMALAGHLQVVEAEKQKLKAQVTQSVTGQRRVAGSDCGMDCAGPAAVSGERVAAGRIGVDAAEVADVGAIGGAVGGGEETSRVHVHHQEIRLRGSG